MSDRGGRTGDQTESTNSAPETADPAASTGTVAADESAATDPSTAVAPTDATAADSSSGRLVVVCGLPGVGKTTVAERVAARLDGEMLRTDVIRKELFPDPEYSDAETEAVYGELLARAGERVAAGETLVLDATFADGRFREDAREAAAATDAEFDLVEVACDEDVVRRRIERRDGISDADFEVYRHFAERFDRVTADHVVVDNSGAQAETFTQVDAAFGSADAPLDAEGTVDAE